MADDVCNLMKLAELISNGTAVLQLTLPDGSTLQWSMG